MSIEDTEKISHQIEAFKNNSKTLIINQHQVVSGGNQMRNKRIYTLIVKEFKELIYECQNPNCPGKPSENTPAEFKSNINIVPQQCLYCNNKIIRLKAIEFSNDKMTRIKKGK